MDRNDDTAERGGIERSDRSGPTADSDAAGGAGGATGGAGDGTDGPSGAIESAGDAVETASEPTESTGATRRALLKAAGASSMGGVLSALVAEGALAEEVEPGSADGRGGVFDASDGRPPATVFPESVASGDPTPSGVLLWTRIAADAYRTDEPLGVEVATDGTFEDVVYRGVVPAAAVDPADDYTVKVDLDGKLESDRFYFYRFFYDGTTSRVGRCRTLPEPDASPDELRVAAVTCQEFSNGYYGAFAHVAQEEVDYIVHLGDAIYEYAAPDAEYEGRDVVLPSGKDVAHGLADFRYLHERYRSDEFYQRALERHTMIATWDDHEIVNNRWWEYDRDPERPASTSHPENGDREFMQRLFAEGIKAYWEFMPVRVNISEELTDYDPETSPAPQGDDLHEGFQLYRSFAFGDLADLAMTDERLYRTDPPGEGQYESDAAPYRDPDMSDPPDAPDRTMLGDRQRGWFLDFLADSTATWTVWGNEVLTTALKTTNDGEASTYLNYDQWDGYQAERARIMERATDTENFVTLTGDLHSYVVAYLLDDYESPDGQEPAPLQGRPVGVEFMTPAITSANLSEMADPSGAGGFPAGTDGTTVNQLAQSQNPHIEFFNSSRWGYSIVEFTREDATYIAYDVDKTEDSPCASRETLVAYRTPAGSDELVEVTGEYTPAEPTTGPDVTGNGMGATDPDCDGLYENVDGRTNQQTGEAADVVDVQALFANRGSDAVANNPGSFDFNEDARLDVVDVQKLFVEVTE
jgi:alkaline phosphatase D